MSEKQAERRYTLLAAKTEHIRYLARSLAEHAFNHPCEYATADAFAQLVRAVHAYDRAIRAIARPKKRAAKP